MIAVFSQYQIGLVKVVVVENDFQRRSVGDRFLKFGGLTDWRHDIDRFKFFRRLVPEATVGLQLCIF